MSVPEWKGLFEWSMRQCDGTQASGFQGPVDADKMKWLESALKHYMQDFASRMKQIKSALDSDTVDPPAHAAPPETERDQDPDNPPLSAPPLTVPAAASQTKEALLEELMDIVSSIDFARDLHKIGGLPTMLELLEGSQPSLVWRATEVVATCMQNNPPVQQWFLEGGILPRLAALLSPTRSADERVKGLLAVSSLIRHFGPGLEAFLTQHQGLVLVSELVPDPDVRVRRKAMSVLQYVVARRRAAAAEPPVANVLPALVAALGNDSGELREGALRVLCEVAACGPNVWAQLHSLAGLGPALDALDRAYGACAAEDRDMLQDEHALAGQLRALLAAPPPLCPPPDLDDEVSAAQYQQRPAAPLHGRSGAGGGDAAAQHTMLVVNAPPAAIPPDTQEERDAGDLGPPPAAAAAAPLLLGPP